MTRVWRRLGHFFMRLALYCQRRSCPLGGCVACDSSIEVEITYADALSGGGIENTKGVN